MMSSTPSSLSPESCSLLWLPWRLPLVAPCPLSPILSLERRVNDGHGTGNSILYCLRLSTQSRQFGGRDPQRKKDGHLQTLHRSRRWRTIRGQRRWQAGLLQAGGGALPGDRRDQGPPVAYRGAVKVKFPFVCRRTGTSTQGAAPGWNHPTDKITPYPLCRSSCRRRTYPPRDPLAGVLHLRARLRPGYSPRWQRSL